MHLHAAPRPTDEAAAAEQPVRARLNINPSTGLSTDYLNHFNEAIMLLEMLSAVPDCVEDLLKWQPRSYREHFAASSFSDRDVVIAAYDNADPTLRAALDTVTEAMSGILNATCQAIREQPASGMMAHRAVSWLKPLVARAGGLINGNLAPDGGTALAPQATVDALLER